MSAPSELPPRAVLISHLAQRLPDWASVEWVDTTGSTNTDLLARARAGARLPALLGTTHQNQGRGRSNRNFHANPGDTLTFSCAFELDIAPIALPTLSVLAGLVACETLTQSLGRDHALCLKWPNDLQWGEAKLAGLLLESAGIMTGRAARVVVGLGVNLRGADRLTAALGRPVADWSHTGSRRAVADVCADLANAWRVAFAQAADAWVEGVGLPDLPARYAQHDALRGRPVNVLENGEVQLQGIADGVAPDGQLRIRTAGGIALVNVGDVSVRAQAGQP
ncbi:biotin--[acetyl-CoA-carboxylase] ligase [Verticiella sediminum]|uniref:biotin--[acetyl-CoA-carboxylase] ligase n=1 Tax=Verticiella sediminum TaxID=1247510 RepID=UPI0014781284|nr:biotin--[acetyl-CoA-carboxylase] ligase [Verticiella sediminum]